MKRLAILFALAISVGMSTPLFAYGPLVVTNDGDAAYLQDNDGNTGNSVHTIYYYPENNQGCGSFSADAMIDLLEDVLGQIEDATLHGSVATKLDLVPIEGKMTDANSQVVNYDVTGTNYQNVYVDFAHESSVLVSDERIQNEQNSVIFDSDGSITAAVHGDNNKCDVLGFAGMIQTSDTDPELLKGQMVINCYPLIASECDATQTQLEVVVLHEFMHMLGADHAQLVDPDNVDKSKLPTMYPHLLSSTHQETLEQDDIVALAARYPSQAFKDNLTSISGDILDEEGEAMPCVEVTATNTADATDVVTTVTGYEATLDQEADDEAFPDGCEENCGFFRIKGLQKNSEYKLTLRNISEDFTGDSRVGRCRTPIAYDLDEEEAMTVESGSSNISFDTSTPPGEGSGDGDGDGDADEPYPSVCSLYTGSEAPVSYAAAFFLFGFTALVLLATGRRCATVKPSSRPSAKLPKTPNS